MGVQKQNAANLEVIDLENYFEILRTYIVENPTYFGDGATVEYWKRN